MKKWRTSRLLKGPTQAMAMTALAALLVTAVSQTASAQLLAYEGFDYDAAASFPDPADGTLAGGSGWADGWVTGAGAPDPGRRIVENSLSYTDGNGDRLATTGGTYELFGGWGAPRRYFDVAGYDQSLVTTNGDLGKYGSSLWISYLGKGIPDDDGDYKMADLTLRKESGSKTLGLGRAWKHQLDGTSNGDNNEAWGIERYLDATPNAPVKITPGVSSTSGETVFMVVKLDFLGFGDRNSFPTFDPNTVGTNLSAWINPNLDAEPVGTDASNFADALNVWEVAFARIEMGGNADTFYDEFRVGITYADVAPIAVGLDGDFDNDGDRDGADFLAWQRGDSPGGGNAADLALWETNFGASAAVSAINAIPEPSSLLLGLGSLLGAALIRRRKVG